MLAEYSGCREIQTNDHYLTADKSVRRGAYAAQGVWGLMQKLITPAACRVSVKVVSRSCVR